MHWVDWYYLETCYRKYIILTYFFQSYPDKTLKNWMTINMNNGKNEWYQTHQLIIIFVWVEKIEVIAVCSKDFAIP